MTNPDYALILGRAFGCELVSYYRQLGTRDAASVAWVIRETGALEKFRFNKEVWSFAKLPMLCAHFDCLVLTRAAESLFPPSRLRVWQWYDAIYNALLVSYPLGKMLLLAGHPRERCLAAHEAARFILETDAARCGVPIIDYDMMASGDSGDVAAVARCIAQRWPLNAEKLAETILSSRQVKPPPSP